jgi:hypothetical protein
MSTVWDVWRSRTGALATIVAAVAVGCAVLVPGVSHGAGVNQLANYSYYGVHGASTVSAETLENSRVVDVIQWTCASGGSDVYFENEHRLAIHHSRFSGHVAMAMWTRATPEAQFVQRSAKAFVQVVVTAQAASLEVTLKAKQCRGGRTQKVTADGSSSYPPSDFPEP